MTAGVLDSYTALKAAVLEETDGRASSASVDRFIKQAEGEIQAFLARNPVRPMRVRTNISISTEYVAGPTDMVMPISLEVTVSGTIRTIALIAPENISDKQGSYTIDGSPIAFARIGDELRFFPTPTIAYSGRLHYYQKLTGIDAVTASNWLLVDYPHIYQAGALYYAYRDMPDIQKAELMKSLFEEGLAKLAESYPEAGNEVTLSVDTGLRQWRRLWQVA